MLLFTRLLQLVYVFTANPNSTSLDSENQLPAFSEVRIHHCIACASLDLGFYPGSSACIAAHCAAISAQIYAWSFALPPQLFVRLWGRLDDQTPREEGNTSVLAFSTPEIVHFQVFGPAPGVKPTVRAP